MKEILIKFFPVGLIILVFFIGVIFIALLSYIIFRFARKKNPHHIMNYDVEDQPASYYGDNHMKELFDRQQNPAYSHLSNNAFHDATEEYKRTNM